MPSVDFNGVTEVWYQGAQVETVVLGDVAVWPVGTAITTLRHQLVAVIELVHGDSLEAKLTMTGAGGAGHVSWGDGTTDYVYSPGTLNHSYPASGGTFHPRVQIGSDTKVLTIVVKPQALKPFTPTIDGTIAAQMTQQYQAQYVPDWSALPVWQLQVGQTFHWDGNRLPIWSQTDMSAINIFKGSTEQDQWSQVAAGHWAKDSTNDAQGLPQARYFGLWFPPKDAKVGDKFLVVAYAYLGANDSYVIGIIEIV